MLYCLKELIKEGRSTASNEIFNRSTEPCRKESIHFYAKQYFKYLYPIFIVRSKTHCHESIFPECINISFVSKSIDYNLKTHLDSELPFDNYHSAEQ